MLLRRFSFALASATVVYVSCNAVTKKKDPYRGLECPEYTVVDKNDDFELRKYSSYKWAAARETGLDYTDATRKNFMKLYRYIQGNNMAKQKIEMTVPVLSGLTVSQGPFCEADFTTHFFVPYALQEIPPKPVNDTDQVFIVKLPELTVYVRSYGGFPNEQKIQENAAALATALQKHGIPFDEKHYYTASYDSPSRLFNRKNEVMFLEQNK